MGEDLERREVKTHAGFGPVRKPGGPPAILLRATNFYRKNRGLIGQRLFWSIAARIFVMKLRRLVVPSPLARAPATLFVATHHKAMTTYFHAVLRLLAFAFNLPFGVVHKGIPPRGTRLFLSTQGKIDRAALRPYRGVHVMRDPRDMIVSGYFYHQWTDESWAHRLDESGRSYQDKLKAADRRTGLHMEIDHFLFIYGRLLESWDMADPDMLELRYEDLMGEGRDGLYQRLFAHLGLTGAEHRLAVDLMRLFEAKSRSGAREGETRQRSHIRSGTSGQWAAELEPEHAVEFMRLFVAKSRSGAREGETRQRSHIRSGTSGQWAAELEPEHVARIEAELGPVLAKFGYAPAPPGPRRRRTAPPGPSRGGFAKLPDTPLPPGPSAPLGWRTKRGGRGFARAGPPPWPDRNGMMTARAMLRQLLPYPAIELARKVLFFGFSRHCEVCGASLRRFLPQGYGYPILERLQIVGGMYKADDRCPVCHASDRDRLIKFYLDRELFAKGPRPLSVLHLAPEKGLAKYLRARPEITYAAGDIEPERYPHVPGIRRMDLLNLPCETGSIDLLICNHVLEHIPDDLAAMREIRRVLAPEGRALLQVPLSLVLSETVEGDGSEPEAEKIRLYGQRDHVRIYALQDYPRRLARAGFAVELWNAFEADEEAAARLRLNPLERLHVCRPA